MVYGFRKRRWPSDDQPERSPRAPQTEGQFIKCESCEQTLFVQELRRNLYVCMHCDHHFRIGAKLRVQITVDADSFVETDPALVAVDPLRFTAKRSYAERLQESQKKTGLQSAALTGTATIRGLPLVFCVTDCNFMMGAMGSVVGEKITRAVEYATGHQLPLVIISGSGGGACMDEGVLSLMQMAKTAAALARHRQAGGLYISVLTNPTFGGVSASFAALGDVILAEPKALIGFTGPRVIRETIKRELPPGFQEAEFLREHGHVDRITQRKDMRDELAKIIAYCTGAQPDETRRVQAIL